jgi:hypothetical protein
VEPEVTDSAVADDDVGDDIPFPVVGLATDSGTAGGSVDQRGRHVKPVLEAPDKSRDTSVPQTKPPTVDEWQDFIGRIVLHTAMEAYAGWILKDIDLTPAELELISLTKEDYKEMSAPLATYTNKNTWARKHGREIIGAADSIESVLALGIWVRRVNRIAKKHRPEKQARRHQHAPGNPQPPQASPAHAPARPDTFTPPQGDVLASMAQSHIDQQANPLYAGSTTNGSSGQTAQEGIRKPNPPGTFGGQFFGGLGSG